jgi:hydroxymethylbilane synthase
MGKAPGIILTQGRSKGMSGSEIIRIATRSSPLAVWQANAVKEQLEARGNTCKLVMVESTGDLQLSQPIYSMGISGVFTKQLDIVLLNGQADIAVHSLKDVPTQLAQNICLAAVLKRGAHEDVIVVKSKEVVADLLALATVATSSLRRKAQWLSRYKNHRTVPIRGNVQTRLKKFEEAGDMDAVIFARAGLERMGLLGDNCITLDWMIPAPAQGIIGIACREDDAATKAICASINHQPSFIAGSIERNFLKALHGGCSVPISALAKVIGDEILFKGAMHSYDGSTCVEVNESFGLADWQEAGTNAANKLLTIKGAAELIEEIRNKSWE